MNKITIKNEYELELEEKLKNVSIITREMIEPYKTKIYNLDIPKGVVEISDKAFTDCKALRKITLPETITKVGIGAFYHCSSLEDINYQIC